MNQGCHGATVEMQSTPSASQVVATGLVVSGVEATSISDTWSLTIRSFATSAGAVGVGLAVLDDDLVVEARAFRGRQEAVDDKLVGLGEGGERPRLRAHIADLDALSFLASAGIGIPRRAGHHAGCAGALEQSAVA